MTFKLFKFAILLQKQRDLSMKINWDGLGIAASVACAIHCAVLPLIFTSLPLFGMDVIKNHTFEYFMIFLALAIGIYSLWHGYKKHHHQKKPILILIIGFAFLLVKEVLPGHPVWPVLPALAGIVTAHVYNYQLCKKAKHCHSEDCNH
ncbi:MerC domain-containing protein [Polluticaenibacter yanchengensis]|uniref:MerC domain-containing protein n=1 Tax=Polluticaenibacter yanchengensis TaxID=3014562 RepID=A0ABT4UQF1_9BACT|nr:MerC domain-containing protein [Chitinophagaceae bacterium LY-5]